MSRLKVPGLKEPIPSEVILWVEGVNNYSIIHFTDNQVYLATHTLKWFESHLNLFVRISKSALVNPDYIRLFEQTNAKKAGLLLQNKVELGISRRRIMHVLDRLNMIALMQRVIGLSSKTG